MVFLKVPWHIICSKGRGFLIIFHIFLLKMLSSKNICKVVNPSQTVEKLKGGNPNINPYIIRRALGIVKLDDEGVSMVTLVFLGFHNSKGSNRS